MAEEKTRPDAVDIYVGLFGRDKSSVEKVAMELVERHPQPGVSKDERVKKMMEYVEKHPGIFGVLNEESG
jgi:hypothetical protein